MFIPDAQTQEMFNDFFRNSFTLSFDSWSTDRETVNFQLEYELCKGSAQKFNNPNYLIVTHQIEAREGVPNKKNNVSLFDSLNVRKNHVDIGSVR